MIGFAVRRIVMAFPTLLAISFVVFMVLHLAPGDPMAQLPMSVPPDVRQRLRDALGLDQPALVQYGKWLVQLFWVEPLVVIDGWTQNSALLGWLPDTHFSDGYQRVISWQSKAPAMQVIAQRLPQTLHVVGGAYVIGSLLALPIGFYAAYRQFGLFDRVSTFGTMLGLALPPFFTGPLMILIFSIWLGWVPAVYDTTLSVTGWDSLKAQLAQMVLPVLVLSVQTTAQISRYVRVAVLDQLRLDFVRTARAKGAGDLRVLTGHVLRNAMIPIVTVLALGVPSVFGGAIITENVFLVNGIGHLLVSALQASDLPLVLTLTFLFAVIIVSCNIVADVLYRMLDPRIADA